MAMRPKAKAIHTSMRGKTVDMDLMRQRNELTPAVGNVRVNARGDELGPGGQIVRKREQVLQDYYATSAKMPDVSAFKNEQPSIDVVEEKIVAKSRAEKIVAKDLTDDWVDDENGNFVQKGK